jgi:hypothetical protein
LRQEDKELDGPDLEQAEERKRQSELVTDKEGELHDLDGQREHRLDEQRSTEVIGAMRKILEGGLVDIDRLQIPQRQLNALRAIQTAYDGKDAQLSRFVFAEDRSTLLEQALAVLQPEIVQLQTLGKPFDDLLKNVGDLRDKLDSLEDAEAELKDLDVIEQKKDDDDADDESDTDDEPEDPDSDKPTTLGDPEEIEAVAARNSAENLANAEPVQRVSAVVPRWKRQPE